MLLYCADYLAPPVPELRCPTPRGSYIVTVGWTSWLASSFRLGVVQSAFRITRRKTKQNGMWLVETRSGNVINIRCCIRPAPPVVIQGDNCQWGDIASHASVSRSRTRSGKIADLVTVSWLLCLLKGGHHNESHISIFFQVSWRKDEENMSKLVPHVFNRTTKYWDRHCKD